ncbi:hypothetical protein [Mycetocola spongiae]|uniref:hypothetical protein n=1 Tax=Mycetocola spongiae TaxID=2859226 RepID=UPI001CF22143|nr:hypothetical protein [Mycetocola spongiae]UCR90438.1 hypothetical protein KXZ72_00930 [Mycetocola spongiae]
MNTSFTLSDVHARADLTVYLKRAKRVDESAIRLIGAGGVLAVYAPVFTPRGILDAGPTILGLRTFADTGGGTFDTVVAPASVLERLARLELEEGIAQEVPLPVAEVRAAWSGIAAPRGGWEARGSIAAGELRAAAHAGIAEIAAALPENAGDPVVAKIRGGVWGAPLEALPELPAGAAFAAESLGFLGEEDEPVAVWGSGAWLRASSVRGHVLIRRGGGLL